MNRGLFRLAGGGAILLGVFLLAHGAVIFLSPNSYVSIVYFKLLLDDSVHRSIGFDPYWLQDQIETLQSKGIIYRVITNLDLTRKWAEKRHKPEPLRIEAVYEQLKKQIDVHQTRGTGLIEVKVGSTEPIEAAAIANEIAEVYLAHRMELRHEMRQRSIRILKDELEKRNRALTDKLAEVEALKASSGTNASEARVVEDLKWAIKKLDDRILEEENDRAGSSTVMESIVDRAEPALHPRHHHNAFTIAEIVGGLGAIAIGTTLRGRGKKLSLPIQPEGRRSGQCLD